MKRTISIPVRITPHHLTLSPALIAKVEEEIAPLARFSGGMVRADVVLRLDDHKTHGKLHTVSARLSLPGGDVYARATHENLYLAISALERHLARRLRKRKTKIEKRLEFDRPTGGLTSAAHLEEMLFPA